MGPSLYYVSKKGWWVLIECSSSGEDVSDLRSEATEEASIPLNDHSIDLILSI